MSENRHLSSAVFSRLMENGRVRSNVDSKNSLTFSLFAIGRCLKRNDSKSVIGRCELEGWCPVENDRNIPEPIFDALNFTIFVKNFIEFPRFKVIRKNIGANASYLRSCQYDSVKHKICPIFRVGTLLDIVEPDRKEQHLMLTLGGVIRVKIDWRCNLDISLDKCLPEYSFGRLDAPYKEESFSQGFNFRWEFLISISKKIIFFF